VAQAQALACSEVYEAFGLWQGPRCIFREFTGHFAGSQRVTILTEPHGRWLPPARLPPTQKANRLYEPENPRAAKSAEPNREALVASIDEPPQLADQRPLFPSLC